MKYFMMVGGASGVAPEDDIPEGAVEISPEVYADSTGYSVVDGALVAPTDAELESLRNLEAARALVDTYYNQVSVTIMETAGLLDDGSYEDAAAEAALEETLKSLRKYRTYLRGFWTGESSGAPITLAEFNAS